MNGNQKKNTPRGKQTSYVLYYSLKAALYTIIPRSPFLAFCTPKHCRLQKRYKMRLNVCFNEMALFGPFAALIKKVVAALAEIEVSPQEEMANPQRMKVFAVERPGLRADFVSFPSLCGVQSSPLVFAPNPPPIVWGPLQ